PRWAMSRRTASVAIVEVVSPGPPTRRSLMPVRVTIQSSEVSSRVARSALVTRRSGTYVATAVMAARGTAGRARAGMHESRADPEPGQSGPDPALYSAHATAHSQADRHRPHRRRTGRRRSPDRR